MFSDVVSNKALAITFQTSKITSEVVMEVIKKALQERTKEVKGKQSLKNLNKKSSLQTIDISDDTLKKLSKYLRKYNIDYSILKNTAKEKTYSLFFRNCDAELLNKIMNDFLKNKFRNKESIKEKILKAKEISKTNLQKVKNIEREGQKRSEKDI